MIIKLFSFRGQQLLSISWWIDAFLGSMNETPAKLSNSITSANNIELKRKIEPEEEKKNVCLLRWKSAASFASVNLSSWLYRVLIQRAQLISHENMEWIRFLMIAFNTFWSDETNPTRFLCTICVRSQRDVQSLPMKWYGQINGIQYIF